MCDDNYSTLSNIYNNIGLQSINIAFVHKFTGKNCLARFAEYCIYVQPFTILNDDYHVKWLLSLESEPVQDRASPRPDWTGLGSFFGPAPVHAWHFKEISILSWEFEFLELDRVLTRIASINILVPSPTVSACSRRVKCLDVQMSRWPGHARHMQQHWRSTHVSS